MKTYTRLVVGALVAFIITFTLNTTTQAQPFAPTNAPGAAAQAAGPEYVPGEVLVKFREDVTDDQIATAFRGAGLQMLKHIQTPAMRDNGQIGITRALSRMPVEQAVALLSQLPGIEYAQPNWIYRHAYSANDDYFVDGLLWGMYGDASTPANQYGSQAAEVWASVTAGSKSVYVGVIDEGIQYDHTDLAANMWKNPLEFAGNSGADEDGNGYTDDIYGWNAIEDSGKVFLPGDDNHGTHVAGTIGAQGGNDIGVVGVNWHINLISGKFLAPAGGYTSDAIQAIDYMTNLKLSKGLNIVALNNSWGGGGYDAALLGAIVRAANAQILFVAAAGNGDWRGRAINTDSKPQYPACYNTTTGAGYDSVISVTSINSSGAKASDANYGATTVDLGAPGVGIYSTLSDNTYGAYSGTSMATPHVTGAIALYAAKYPGASAQAIKDALFKSVTSTPSLASTTFTKGRLDITKMLAIVPPGWAPPGAAPSAPSDLAATPVSHNQITLTWTDNSGTETYFTLTRSTDPAITTDDVVINVPGNTTTYTDSGLTAETTYTYSIKACNVAGCSVSAGSPPATTAPLPNLAQVTDPVIDSANAGNWIGNYGRQGYRLFNSSYSSNPSYVSPVVAGFIGHTWTGIDERALQTPDGTSRFAACYYTFDETGGAGASTIDLNFNDNAQHRVSLYCVDYDLQSRKQLIQVVDRNYPSEVLKQVLMESFSGGQYVTFDITGDVIIKILWVNNAATGGDNAVVSGIFFDDPAYTPSTIAAPSALTAQAVLKTQINLTWVDNSNNETEFQIERSTSATTGFTIVGTVLGDAMEGDIETYADTTGLFANKTYYYRVRAVKDGDTSDYSNTASAKTPRK